MPLLLCPSDFKGTFTASQVASALADGIIAENMREPDICPLADGGDGTMAVLLNNLGGELMEAEALNAVGENHTTSYCLLTDGSTAIVEVAAVNGLASLQTDELDPLGASSYGTGQLIAAAVAAGTKEILVAAGGSAMTDGGLGAVEAIEESGGLGKTKLTVLCDVNCSFEQAAELFGPQKGASLTEVNQLTKRLQNTALKQLPRDPRGVAFSGAAGGLAGGLWAKYNAKLVSGARYVLNAVNFDQRMRAAQAIVVGEGQIDHQSLLGKASGEAAVAARQAGVPAFAVVGSNKLTPFEQRILDLQRIFTAKSLLEIKKVTKELAKICKSSIP